MKRAVVLFVIATVTLGIGTGFAATLNVGSHHLWAGTQTLTKSSCTLTGTSQTTDTYVNQASPTNSYGTGATTLVQPNSGAEKQTLIRFDLSSCNIPATGGADSATLTLVVTSAPKKSRTLTVTPITSTWSSTTTWNSAPTVGPSPTTTFSTGVADNASISIPVTIDVDDLIKSSAANYGWRISDQGSSAAQDTTTFASSDAASNKPRLMVNYEK
jgi:hypothetical protein